MNTKLRTRHHSSDTACPIPILGRIHTIIEKLRPYHHRHDLSSTSLGSLDALWYVFSQSVNTCLIRRRNAFVSRDRLYLLQHLIDVADSISIAEFMSNEKYGRSPLAKSPGPFVCGLTGKSYTALEVVEREEYLTRALSKRLDLNNATSEWDRVVAIFSLNTVSKGVLFAIAHY